MLHPMRAVAALLLLSGLAGLLLQVPPAVACDVGDPRAAPQLIITSSPPDCCAAAPAGTVTGTVWNVDTQQVIVVVYALTDVYYVQPVLGATVTPSCGGVWSTWTHGGSAYVAILARSHWTPPAMLTQLPAVGGPVLAVVSAPETQRRLDFAGRSWIVKTTGPVPFGPGPNLWSDAAENVWVDADGLHLRIVERDGQWTCAEVMSEGYIGYGRLRFEVDGAIDAMDPQVVFAGFFYADGGNEADIEWSRWGDPASPTNAQYVVQPDARQPLSLALGGGASTHEIHWRPQGIDFATWSGVGRTGSPPLASWTHAAGLEPPQFERVHFNLWLLNGAAPASAVEVVIRAFESGVPSDVAASRAAAEAARLQVPTVARGSLPYRLDLTRDAAVRLRLFDPRGRVVHEMVRRSLPAGTHEGEWRPGTASLAQGLYFLHLEAGGSATTARVVLLH